MSGSDSDDTDDAAVVFSNVGFEGKRGCVTLTDQEVIFEDSNPLRVSKSEWRLDAVKETIMKPVTASVELKLQMGDAKEMLSLQMTSLAEVVRFRKQLEQKVKKRKQPSQHQQQPSQPSLSKKNGTISNDQRDAAASSSFSSLQQQKKHETSNQTTARHEEESTTLEETTDMIMSTTSDHTAYYSSSRAASADHQQNATMKRNKTCDLHPAERRRATTSTVRSRTSSIATRNNHIVDNKLISKEPKVGLVTRQSVSDHLRTVHGYMGETDISPVFGLEMSDSGDEDDEDEGSMSEFAEDTSSSWEQTGASKGHCRRSTKVDLSMSLSDLDKDTTHQKGRRTSNVLDLSSQSDSGMRTGRRRDTIAGSVPDLAFNKKNQQQSGAVHMSGSGSSASARRKSSHPRLHASASSMTTTSSSVVEPPRLSARERPSFKAEFIPGGKSSATTTQQQKSGGSISLVSAAAKELRRVITSSSLSSSQQQHSITNPANDNNHDDTEESQSLTHIKEENMLSRELTKSAELEKSEKSAEFTSSTTDLEAGTTAATSTPGVSSFSSNRRTGRRASGTRNSFLSFDGLIEARVVDEESSSDENNNGDPTIVASAVNVDEENRKRRQQNVRMAVGCGCTMILVIIMAALAGANVFGGGNNTSGNRLPPPLSPEERFELIRDRVATNVIFDKASLDNVNSPQSIALNWLAKEDTFYTTTKDLRDADDIALLQERLEQRYTLAVFYFTMAQASRWAYCQPPETGEVMACVHPVLETYANEGIFYDQHMSEPAFRWLSAVTECSWAGVKCIDGLHVSKLELAGYKLQSTLPIEIGFLQSLQVLDLQHNSLVGPLPPEWGVLETNNTALESIRLDQNHLTGTIPEEWCQMNSESLRTLVLSNNMLTGTIPSCLSQFSELEDFSVMHNSLTGTVPSELGSLIHLQTLHVAGNNMTGKVPEDVCDLTRYELREASADCLDILSEHYVQCSCCTTCCAGGNREDCLLS